MIQVVASFEVLQQSVRSCQFSRNLLDVFTPNNNWRIVQCVKPFILSVSPTYISLKNVHTVRNIGFALHISKRQDIVAWGLNVPFSHNIMADV